MIGTNVATLILTIGIICAEMKPYLEAGDIDAPKIVN